MMGLMSICAFFFGEARCEAIGWNWFYHKWKRPAGHAINEHCYCYTVVVCCCRDATLPMLFSSDVKVLGNNNNHNNNTLHASNITSAKRRRLRTPTNQAKRTKLG